MELVRGIKITEYCDQNSLTIEKRPKLLVQVCQAAPRIEVTLTSCQDFRVSSNRMKCPARNCLSHAPQNGIARFGWHFHVFCGCKPGSRGRDDFAQNISFRTPFQSVRSRCERTCAQLWAAQIEQHTTRQSRLPLSRPEMPNHLSPRCGILVSAVDAHGGHPSFKELSHQVRAFRCLAGHRRHDAYPSA